MYRKRKSIADTEGKDQEEDVHPRHNEDDQGEALNSYERNKANNMRSNIVLVTAMSNNSSNDDGEESFGDAKVSSGVVNNTVRSDVYTCKKSEEDMTKGALTQATYALSKHSLLFCPPTPSADSLVPA